MRFAPAVTVLVAVLHGTLAPAMAGAAPPPRGGGPGGFRMDGDAKIVTVFGDTAQFKRYVDRFYTLHADMQRVHEDFSRNLQSVLASIAAHRAAAGKPSCPTDAIALAYSRAFRQGQRYHKLGKELEALYVSIRDLDELGETKGLTPDYRWKVSRALKLYGRVLADFREMQASFEQQLSGELTFQGCDPQVLVAKGEELEKTNPPPATAVVELPGTPERKGGKKGGKAVDPAPPVPATTVTFLVDNSSCASSLRVHLDGALLGEVASHARAAFRTLAGPHDMCLIPSTSRQSCGAAGTLRHTYVHDGWTIAMRCGE